MLVIQIVQPSILTPADCEPCALLQVTERPTDDSNYDLDFTDGSGSFLATDDEGAATPYLCGEDEDSIVGLLLPPPSLASYAPFTCPTRLLPALRALVASYNFSLASPAASLDPSLTIK